MSAPLTSDEIALIKHNFQVHIGSNVPFNLAQRLVATVDAEVARAETAEAALAAISDLHTSDVLGHCLQDGFTYPCPTVRLLDVPDQPEPTGADDG